MSVDESSPRLVDKAPYPFSVYAGETLACGCRVWRDAAGEVRSWQGCAGCYRAVVGVTVRAAVALGLVKESPGC